MTTKMKSAQDNVLDYLKTNAKEWTMSAELQRMSFKNKRGTNATPRSIVRRLEELENEWLIAVGYNGINAKYRYIPENWRNRYIRSSERSNKYSNMIWKLDKEISEREKMLKENAAAVRKFDREYAKEHPAS